MDVPVRGVARRPVTFSGASRRGRATPIVSLSCPPSRALLRLAGRGPQRRARARRYSADAKPSPKISASARSPADRRASRRRRSPPPSRRPGSRAPRRRRARSLTPGARRTHTPSRARGRRTTMSVTSSCCARAVVNGPTSASATASSRSPSGERSLRRAPSARRTAGMSDAGSAWTMLPPIVPRLRTCRSPIPRALAQRCECRPLERLRSDELVPGRERADVHSPRAPRCRAGRAARCRRRGWPRDAQLHHGDERLSARDRLGIRLGEELERLIEVGCAGVARLGRITASPRRHGSTRRCPGSRCSGRGCRATRAGSPRRSETSRESRSAAVRITPGCRTALQPVVLDERALDRVQLSVLREPLDRGDLAPSAWCASTVQLLTARPSRSTVHAPHWLVSQPMCAPVPEPVPECGRAASGLRLRASAPRR